MDTGELRKRILHALDAARKDSSERRKVTDEASAAFEKFLDEIGAPLMKQAASVLTAEKQRFVADTPQGSVRLSSETSPQTFIEFLLDTTGARPQVIGRVSLALGRQRVDVQERPIATGKAVSELEESDVAAFLVAEVPKLIVK